MKSSSYGAWWGLASVLVIASAVLVFWRLDHVPDLPVDLGPDLTVRRSKPAEGSDSILQISRGDRLIALNGHTVSKLSDVRSIGVSLAEAVGTQTERDLTVDFQAVRPLHRFTLTLRGESFDGNVLPMGVEPTDALVEVDGRALPGRVGPEGLKSIMTSRPEAVLGFERNNAVFGGKLDVIRTALQQAYLLVFCVAGFVILLLVRLRSRRLDARFAASVALETVFYAWVVVLFLRYQWFISDSILSMGAVTALSVVRPVAFVGRSFERDDDSRVGTLLSLGMAVVAAIAVNILMHRGMLTTERALQFAAVTGSLYIVYELVAGFARAAGSSRLERSVFLVGVIVICALAALFDYLAEPTQFLEDQWIPYAAIALGLVWFSDVILCLRGPAVSGLDEIAGVEGRQQKIVEYFGVLCEELEGTAFRIVLYRPGRSVSIGQGLVGLEVNAVDASLHDAMAIMIDEGARIPRLESTNLHGDPMSGIARTMSINAATVIPAPAGGAQINDMFLILLGFDVHKGEGEAPEVTVEFLESAHRLMTGTVWTAAVLEGAPLLAGETVEIGPAEPAVDPEMFDELESRISELESEAEDLTDVHADLERSLGVFAAQADWQVGPPLELMGTLVEPELIDGLRYLVETLEPIVICGPKGAGKRYTSFLCHALDEESSGYLLRIDAARIADDRGFPDIESIDDSVFAVAAGGALVVQSCGLLTVQQIKALLHRAKGSFRLYLLFDVENPDKRSALENYRELDERLAHRELVIPRFRTRHSIKKAVIQYYLNEAALRLRKDVVGISSDAWEMLLERPFVGGVEECRVVVQTAVARAESEVLDEHDFA